MLVSIVDVLVDIVVWVGWLMLGLELLLLGVVGLVCVLGKVL